MKSAAAVKGVAVIAAIGAGIVLGRTLVVSAQPVARGDAPVTVTESGPTNRIFFRGYDGTTKVSPRPGFLVVDAEATLLSKTEDLGLYWYLAIGTATNPPRVVHEVSYPHQEFTIRKGKAETFTFREAVELPPGKYIVTLKARSHQNIRDVDGTLLEEDVPFAADVFRQIVE